MTPRRVLLATGSMAAGGSERQLLGILKHLDRSRFLPELYVVYPGGELFDETPSDVPVHVFTDRYRIPRWSVPGTIHRARIRDFAQILELRRIDLVYDRTYHMTLTTAGAVRRRPTPRVSVIVGDPQRDFEANPERFRPIKRRLLQRAYREADIVATVSEGVRQRTIEYYGLPPGHVETAYNFFDIARIDRLAQAPLPAEFARRGGVFRILAVGRLHIHKGYDVLIDAMRMLVHERGCKAVELVIVGGGDCEAELRRRIRASSLEEHVALAGFQRNPLPFLRTADLYCLSSRSEGMPNALVEAMLCGVPALATDCVSGPREILQDGRWGRLVPPEHADQLCAAIEDAIHRPAAWRSRTLEARRFVERTFSVQAGMERLTRLFDDAIERFHPRQE